MESQPPEQRDSLDTIPWNGEDISRLILGTVQLGLSYGIANVTGKPSLERASAIVGEAWACGITHFDTAQAYGDSENVLGRVLQDLGIKNRVSIESKLSSALDPTDIPAVRASIEQTFEHLGVEKLWCMMLHNSDWLENWENGLGPLLRTYRDEGRILHLGASLDRPGQAKLALENPGIDIIQLASNAWDTRMIDLGVTEEARERGKLCCVRSIYLKGLLVLPSEVVAERLPFAHQASVRWHEICREHAIPPVEMAVRYALGLGLPLVVGAESAEQVADTARLARCEPLAADAAQAIREAMAPVLDEAIVHPHTWEGRGYSEPAS